MKQKNRYSDHFLYDLPKYLLVLFVSVLFWYFAFHIYHAPKKNESIGIFFSGNVENMAISTRLEKEIDGLESCSISSCLPTEAAFQSKYGVIGLTGSDILLLTEDVANNTAFQNSIVKMDISQLPSNLSYYTRAGETYGIYLPSEVREALSPYFQFLEGPYVILFTDVSIHTGDVTTLAYDTLSFILSLSNP